MSNTWRDIGNGYFAGRPVPVVIMIVVYLVIWFVLERTRFGKQVYAVGGNAEAARLAGNNVRRVTTAVYVIAGACAGLAGIIVAARVVSAQPTAGIGFELDPIAAVALGGTSLFGGRAGLLRHPDRLGDPVCAQHRPDPDERPVLHPAADSTA